LLKAGLGLLATAFGLGVLLSVLGLFGVAHFGPCGPDLLGLIIFAAIALSLVGGVLATSIGAVIWILERLAKRPEENGAA
jgi:hypothetical protein